MNILYDKPGIIILSDNVIRTTKIKKYIEKHKLDNYTVQYLDPLPTDFKEIERELKALEQNYLGLGPLKEKIQPEVKEDYPFKYRVNFNTVLAAYNENDLNKLKMLYDR